MIHRVPRIFAAILIFGVTAGGGDAADTPATRNVTADDLPRVPATEPSDAIGTFKLAAGFELELVAAEPLVADPVDACFDEFGRMYVAEMHGYPFSQEPTKLNPSGGGKQDAGVIRLLEDTDGDGAMDRSVVFADGISWPTSVCCYNGGVFVLAPKFLYYFKDTSGDGRADVREVILSGFGRDNVQALANNLKWGLDHTISFAAGRNPVDLTHRGEKLFTVRGSDLRFNPRTEDFERITGGQQFGHSTDDWGNRFVCSNSNHIQQVVYRREYLDRNPQLSVSGVIRSIAADGASARVFRSSPPEPWRIIRQKWRAEAKGYRLAIKDNGGWEFVPLDPSKKKGAVPTEYPVGFFTSATGVTIYRGSAYPEPFRGNVFVGDVGGNLVHRKILEPNGVVMSAHRADEGEELIRSSDNWFRPVNFVNAPDGTLYVLDMYRETVEHPYSIPDEIKQHLHLQSGADRGRIYRLIRSDMTPASPRSLGDLNGSELAAELESGNSWNRETAQRLIWERQDRSAIPALVQLVKSSSSPHARMHALYSLAGLEALSADLAVSALDDRHPRVREHALRLSEQYGEDADLFAGRLVKLADDPDARVRFQLGLSLGAFSGRDSLDVMARLARDSRNTGDIQTALLLSAGPTAERLLNILLQDNEFLKSRHGAGLLSELTMFVGATDDAGALQTILEAATSEGRPLALQQTLLRGLGQGLARRRSSLGAQWNSDSTPARLRERLVLMFERARLIALDERQPPGERSSAVGLLAFADFDTVAESLESLLSPRTPQTLQRSVVAALSQHPSKQVSTILLNGWRGFSPQVRRDVVNVLLSSTSRVHDLLAAVQSGTIKRSGLERDRKQLLMNHPNQSVRDASRKLFGGEFNSNRAKVVAEYRNVLELDADASRGRNIFKKICSACHRVGNTGHRVAPDLVSVQNKSTEDLLIAILDPNREAQPNFNTYNVVTDEGRVFNGIIVAETATTVTLRRAEAKDDVVPRKSIDTFAATGMSLMPEGLEKDLKRQDLADVIAFVKSIRPESAGAAANR